MQSLHSPETIATRQRLVLPGRGWKAAVSPGQRAKKTSPNAWGVHKLREILFGGLHTNDLYWVLVR